MIDLGLTDKILIRDQLIRILKQELFLQSGSQDMRWVSKLSGFLLSSIFLEQKKHNQRHHVVVVQQPQPSSSEASGESSDESSVSHRTDDRNRPELETKIPDSSTTLQEYEPEYNGHWYKGLCECCDPGCKCRRCCITCCLWPITISRNAEAVGLSNSYTWPWMLTFSIGLCFCTSCLTRAVLRTQIRQKYGIPGSHCNGKNCCVT